MRLQPINGVLLMSESVLPGADNGVPVLDSITQIAGGAMLRMAREAQGLHIAALAVSLKVPVKKLEALETGQFDLLPDIVFVRALASSVCRTLKIDPEPILANLPHSTLQGLKTGESGINVPFRASRDGLGMSLWDQLTKPVTLAVLVLMVGVLVLVFFPFPPRTEIVGASKSETAAPVFLPPPAAVLAPENSVAVQTMTSNQSSTLEASSSQALLALNPASTASSAPLPSPAPSELAVMVPGSGAMTGIVVIRARGSSWVEIVDATGTVQVRKTMSAGEVVGASGVLPLAVVVGRSDTTEVQVRGVSIDLSRIAKDNVARFEVK